MNKKLTTFKITATLTASQSHTEKIVDSPKDYSNAISEVLGRRIRQDGFAVSEAEVQPVGEADPDHEYFVVTAKQDYIREGEVEIDDNAVVSSSEKGAYVQAWVWVDRPKGRQRKTELP